MEPEDVLRGYMMEMRVWEMECARRDDECFAGTLDFSRAAEMSTREYQLIFQKYCSQIRTEPRGFHYSIPPDYNPEDEQVSRTQLANADVAEITTYRRRTKDTFLYRLAREEGQWRLFEKLLVGHDKRLVSANL